MAFVSNPKKYFLDKLSTAILPFSKRSNERSILCAKKGSKHGCYEKNQRHNQNYLITFGNCIYVGVSMIDELG